MSSGRGESETAAFTSTLASLKRRGSNLLLVGTVGETTHADACGRLLGSDDAWRRRLFVRTEGEGATARSPDADEAEVVRYEHTTRSAAGASTASPTSPPTSDRSARTLTGLAETVDEAIEEIDDAAGGLGPAELRACFDSLRPLLEEYPEHEVFRFVHSITAAVRTVNGMAHYHLPVPYDSATVRTLGPLFDAVIEVRSGPDGPQQRWHLRDTDVTTDWLQL